MKMKKWLISAITLTFALGIAGAVTAFAITADGGTDNPVVPEAADTAGEGPPGFSSDDEWTVATSIDDIDPNVCNAIHNINACTPEELEELGMAPITGSITQSEPDPGTEVGGDPVSPPPFEDVEIPYEVQSYEDAVKQDCGLAGGAFYVSSDGEVGCVIVHDLEDGGEGETQAQPPVVMPQPVPSAE